MTTDYLEGKIEYTSELEGYLDALRRSGRKDNTIYTIRSNVRQCIKCLVADGRPYMSEEITTDDIAYLFRTLPVKEEVARSYLRTLAGMVIYYTGRDVVKQANLLYNREQHTRIFITREEFRTLYQNATPFQRLVIMLGGCMGLRRCEMHSIRDGDIKGNTMVIHGKGHGTKGMMTTVTIPEPVIAEIAAYRQWKEENHTGQILDDFLLQKANGVTGVVKRCGISTISNEIHQLGEDCGIIVTTHSFRRFFGTSLYYEAHTDLQTVKNLMRHANVATTLKCYVEASDIREREAMGKLMSFMSPLF